MASTIQLIQSAITSADHVQLATLIMKMPLHKVSVDAYDKLLASLIQQAQKQNDEVTIHTILDAFYSHENELYKTHRGKAHVAHLALNRYLTDDNLKFIINCFEQLHPIQLFIPLVEMQTNSLNAVVRWDNIIDKLSMKKKYWDALYHMTLDPDFENIPLRQFFVEKLIGTTSVDNKPPWIVDKPKGVLVPITIVPVNEAVDIIERNMRDDGIHLIDSNVAQQRDILTCRYALCVTQDKYALIGSTVIFDDVDVFREYGPVNSTCSDHPDLYEENHECRKYGGCRMFLCTEYVYEDSFDDSEHDHAREWFMGECEKCVAPISKKHYALRKPVLYGGWSGCFCSFGCMDDPSDNILMKGMIKETEQQVKEIGIRDRS